jgi:hypothetical protein
MHEAMILSLLTQTPSDEQGQQERKTKLASLLNELILHDFHALVQLLYRVDVSEKQVKQLLQQQPGTDAGLLLASLLIERQEDKAALRQQFKTDDTHIADEDRW